MFLKQFLLREKAIFEILNKLTRQGSITHGYVWSHLSKEDFLEKFYGPDGSLINNDIQNSAR